MRTIKKLMSANKGREGNSTLRADVLKHQRTLLHITPDAKDHRVLNVFVSSYLDKLNLKKSDATGDASNELLTIDYVELMKQKAVQALRTDPDPIRLAVKVKR